MAKNETEGYRINPTGKIVKEKIVYNHELPSSMLNPSTPVFGSPITEKVAQKLIQNYWDKLVAGMDDNEVVSVTFGKDDLISILNQNDCIGIRFYYATRLAKDFDGDSEVKNGITLVAVGLKAPDYDIATEEKKYIVKPLKPHSNNSFKQSGIQEDGIIYEMVPPDTLGYFLNQQVKSLDKGLAEIIKQYFNSK